MRQQEWSHTREPVPESSMGGDLRGAGRLVVEAVVGLAGLVETVHANVARLPGTRPPRSGRTRGITAFVYATARGVTHVVGGTVDTALSLLEPLLAERSTRPGYGPFWRH